MKRINKIFVSLISVLTLVTLGSCGEEETNNIYKISYEENENYKISNLATTGQTGSNILFNVESTSVFYEIEGVYYNGKPAEEGSLGYTFIMPSEDVVVTIKLNPIATYDPDDYLTWGENAIDFLAAASEEDKASSLDCYQNIPLSFNMREFGNYNNVVETKEVISSNQEVIPNSAIEFDEILASDSNPNAMNTVVGGNIVVDLKQINPGTATIYVHLDFNNAADAILMRTFTVKEYGEIELESWDVEFEIDNRSKYDDLENIEISFNDRNFVYGSKTTMYQSFKLNSLDNLSGSFIYAVGHSYDVRVNHLIWNEEENRYDSITSLTVLEWMGEGSSTTGFNEINDGVLTLVSKPTNPLDITIDD